MQTSHDRHDQNLSRSTQTRRLSRVQHVRAPTRRNVGFARRVLEGGPWRTTKYGSGGYEVEGDCEDARGVDENEDTNALG